MNRQDLRSQTSCSNFYEHIRNAYETLPQQRVASAIPLSELQHRLSSIVNRSRSKGNTPTSSPPQQAQAHQGHPQVHIQQMIPSQCPPNTVQQQAPRFDGSTSPSIARPSGDLTPQPTVATGGDPDNLTQEEMECFDVMELTASLTVAAGTDSPHGPQLALLSREATMSFRGGAIILQEKGHVLEAIDLLQIQNLVEVEDRSAHLFFVLASNSQTRVLDVEYPSNVARNAVWKVSCNRRNFLEKMNALKNAQPHYNVRSGQ